MGLRSSPINGELIHRALLQVRRDAFEFRRDVIVGAEDPLTGLTVGEALLRWLEGRIRKRERQEEKLKAKVQAIKQGSVRAESGKMWVGTGSHELQYIDLHQLEIENEQFACKVEESKADIAAKKRRCCELLSQFPCTSSWLEPLGSRNRGTW